MEQSSIEEIFGNLNQTGVRYLVVGGLAVVAHGYVRFTADIDLFLDFEPDNLRDAMSVFSRLDYRPRAPVELDDFVDPKNRKQWIREKNLKVFSIWSPNHPATEVDIFTEPPIDFNEAFSRSTIVEAAPGLALSIIGLDDLIRLKLVAGRPQDLDDIDKLRELRKSHDKA